MSMALRGMVASRVVALLELISQMGSTPADEKDYPIINPKPNNSTNASVDNAICLRYGSSSCEGFC